MLKNDEGEPGTGGGFSGTIRLGAQVAQGVAEGGGATLVAGGGAAVGLTAGSVINCNAPLLAMKAWDHQLFADLIQPQRGEKRSVALTLRPCAHFS